MNAAVAIQQQQLATWTQADLYTVKATDPDTGRTTVGLYSSREPGRDLVDLFVKYTTRPGKTTAKGYTAYLRQFASWMDDRGIRQPVEDDVLAYRDDLAARELSAGTQAQYIRGVKMFFKWTQRRAIYPDIADGVGGAKVRHDVHKRDALDRDDVAKIADTIDRTTETGKRAYALYMIAITCGDRVVELHRADVGDLHTVGGVKYLDVQRKGHDEKDATVEIIPEVWAALDDYLKARTDTITAKSPLFVSTSNNSKGKRIAATTISALIKQILVNAGYDSARLTAHSLRHTSATGCYNATKDPEQTRDHCGHADISTTQIYIHEQDRKDRHTEQLVYNYYFRNDDTADQLDRATRILAQLDAAQLEKTIAYMNTL